MRSVAVLFGLLVLPAAPAQNPPVTGPETEKRFPPLAVPEGFKATLFACDPLIEYPSVLSLGPRTGTMFLAHDYVTGLGVKIVRRDEIRLVEDADGDGYADRSTVYAKGFNSIQGLAYHAGTVFAMHAPHLTSLRDKDGDGVADERRRLITGLGLPPEENSNRLHCANGVTVGHDGWLYLSLGDRGCDVRRPEGDRLVFRAGGILRCRPDGSDLHAFSTGLRNIYDVALDEELNVYTRDNENDGGIYMIRMIHSFFGADHGYPYHYYERPDEAMPPLADMGRGSSAGGVCYLEEAFPPPYRGNLIFCEWGRSVVRYRRDRAGATFAPMKEFELAAGAQGDPYGFKPTDVVVDYDGSLLVSDWADGQRPKRGRGRVYRIRYGKASSSVAPDPQTVDEWVARLDSAGYHSRVRAQAAIERRGPPGVKAVRRAIESGGLGVLGRLHAVWVLARDPHAWPLLPLLELAEFDPDPRVRAQAVRAVADLGDPVLARHRLDAGPGDAALARRLAALAVGEDPRVALEVVVALGRLRWTESVDWIAQNLRSPDPALAHAAMQTFRRSGNWPAVLRLLDRREASPARAIALRAVAEQIKPVVADGLIERLRTEEDADRRREYADALTRIHRKPAPWTYWGFRPAPRTPNPAEWERTRAIGDALDRAVGDPDRTVRTAVLRRMEREAIPIRMGTLIRVLQTERDGESVAAILEILRKTRGGQVREPLQAIVEDKTHTVANRLAALRQLAGGGGGNAERRLRGLAVGLETPPVLAEAIRALGRVASAKSRRFLLAQLESSAPEVRAAAIDALAEMGDRESGDAILKFLADPEVQVRRSAASAVGKLRVRAAADLLLDLARHPDADLRRRSLESLGRLGERRSADAAVAALADPVTRLAALRCLGAVGGPEHARAVGGAVENDRSVEILNAGVGALAKWKGAEVDRAIARIHGVSGVLVRWDVRKPRQDVPEGRTVLADGLDARVRTGGPGTWVGLAVLEAAAPTRAQFLASSNGTLQVSLNGRPVYTRSKPGSYRPDSDRFEASLKEGANRLVVRVTSSNPAEFHVRFRGKSSKARHERLTQQALASRGNPGRGRDVFLNEKKSSCVKCHQIAGKGGKIGPDLTGIGRRFSRVHLIEALLEPSRTIAPSFQNFAFRLKDGRILAGVKVEETGTGLIVGDTQGNRHELRKDEIDAQKALTLSVMPEGMEKGLSDREFVDLIAFLVSQK